MTKQSPIPTRPISENEKLMRAKFDESVTAQSDLMDKLSGQLLTLELAIPGAYATILKLIGGDKAAVKINVAFYIAFACWFIWRCFDSVCLIAEEMEG